MRRRRLLILGLGLSVGALATLALYRAWRYVPDYYEQALGAIALDQAVASDELLRRASALASDASQEGKWQALFTTRQINGWLAVDVPRNHSQLLPPGFHDPRVAIENGEFRVAVMYGEGRFATVCSVTLGLQTLKSNTMALRVEKVRAGLIPLPMNRVLSLISDQARRAGMPIEWRQEHGNPVAIVRVPPLEDGNTLLVVRRLQLGQGELYVAGLTEIARIADTREPSDTR